MVNLRELVPKGVEFYHLIDKYASGDQDEDWIPKLRIEGGWVVITADAGRNSKVGQKLPDLCVIHRVTHIILKGQLHHKTTLEKSDLIAGAWPRLQSAFSAPHGSRYLLRLRPKKGRESPAATVELCKVTARYLAKSKTRSSKPDNG